METAKERMIVITFGFLVLLFSCANAALGHPPEVTLVQDEASTQEVVDEEQGLNPLELPAKLRVELAEVEELRAEERLQEARQRLSELMAGEVYTSLLEQKLDVVLAGLSALEDASNLLYLGEIRLQACEKRVEILSACRESEDRDLLEAQLELGKIRWSLSQFASAKPLLRYVHDTWGRLLPPEDLDLLDAQACMVLVLLSEGDARGAHELCQRVHDMREKQLSPANSEMIRSKQHLAVLRARLGNPEGARELEEQVLSTLEQILSSEHPALLTAKMNLAVSLLNLGETEAAYELFLEVYEGRKKLLPPEHPDLLLAMMNLGVASSGLGEIEQAHEMFEAVHANWEKTLSADHPDRLSVMQNLAQTCKELGDVHRAMELTELVVEAREKVLAPEDMELLEAKMNLAGMYKDLGRTRDACDLQEEIHEIWERVLPPSHQNLLKIKHNLALTLKALGEFQRARDLIEYVLEARERLLPPTHSDLLASKGSMAGLLETQGNLEAALELRLYVHDIRERTLPPDHPDLLRAKVNLASIYRHQGDLTRAFELEEYVLDRWVTMFPADHPETLTVLMNAATTRKLMGDLKGAQALFEKVLEVRLRLYPPDHPDVCSARVNLAATLWDQRRFLEARDLLQRAHDDLAEQLPEDHPTLIAAKVGLAVAMKTLGDVEGALALEEEAVAARGRGFPEDHPYFVAAQLNLAQTCKYLGKLDRALGLETQVVETWERLLPEDHVHLLEARQCLAETYVRAEALPEAVELAHSLLAGQLARAAALSTESARVARAGALTEFRRLSFPLLLSELLGDERGQEIDEQVFSVLENLRMVSTCSSRTVSALNRRPELEEHRRRMVELRTRINDLCFQPETEVPEEEWREELVTLAAERDEHERALHSELRALGALTAPPTVEGVAKELAADSALISFFRYPRLAETDVGVGGTQPGDDSLLAFVVTPDGKLNRIDLGPAAVIQELALEWRTLLGSPVNTDRAIASSGSDRSPGVGGIGPAPGEEETIAGSALREKLLKPCLAILGPNPPSSIHVILDDFLHLLPVDALPVENGVRLGEMLEVRLETSAQRLLSRPVARSEEGILVAMGDVDFGAEGIVGPIAAIPAVTPPYEQPLERRAGPGLFRRLVETRSEVEGLGELYRSTVGDESVVLTGSDATKRALAELAPTIRFLHVATHGWFASKVFWPSLESGPELTGSTALSQRVEESIHGFAPETLCGLALAGANLGRDEQGRVPGILTAEELSMLELSVCELAVLSACETNVGVRSAGQGIQSLQAALHTAGVRSSITSLWAVDDEATRELMSAFYTKLWKEGLGKAEALWQAKMALREEGHPPRDWAGWVLCGSPD